MTRYYVRERGLIYVPILKNASTTLGDALRRRWPEMQTANCESTRGRRIAMWRDPYKRMESTYKMMVRQGLGNDFSKYVVDVCKCSMWPHDPHLKPQHYFGPVDQVVPWDFDLFARLFKLKDWGHLNKARSVEVEWNASALKHFKKRYRQDIEIWDDIKKAPSEEGA